MKVKVKVTRGELDPDLPDTLRRYITESEWTHLGQDLKPAFGPAIRHGKCVSLLHMIVLVCFVGCFLSIFFVGSIGFVLFLLLFVGTFVSQVCFQVTRIRFVEPRVKANTDLVFQSFSEAHGNAITFNLIPKGLDKMVSEKGARLYTNLNYVLEVLVDRKSAYRLTSDDGDVDGLNDQDDDVEKQKHTLATMSDGIA